MGKVAMAIDNKLRAELAPARLAIEDESSHHHGHAGWRGGGETHFRVEIVSAAFEGQSRVARQRLGYAALKDEFPAGLHVLAITTLTPVEAQRPGASRPSRRAFPAVLKVPR